MTRKNWRIAALGLAATVVLAFLAARRPMDFRVYYYGARGVFDGTRPVYGRTSGLGWPMHYRYPPLFLLLFAPFAEIPLGVSAAVWVILKAIVLALLVTVMVRSLPDTGASAWWFPLLLAGPYVVQDFHYGNAQFFVFALSAAGLLWARRNAIASAASLALAVSIKVWPLFFLPYLVVRGERKVVAWTLIFTALLTLVPSIYFGFGGNLNLLEQWTRQEFATQAGQEEIWFPSQSLRGVLMRYLTVIDYSLVPDSNYRQVNVTQMNPRSVRLIWFATAGIVYVLFLFWAYRRRHSDGWIEVGLAFCLIALLEPFTQKYALVVLLWPAIASTRLLKDRAARRLLYAAIGLICIQPLIPGSAAQRLMQVLGFDFAATTFLAAAFWKRVNSNMNAGPV